MLNRHGRFVALTGRIAILAEHLGRPARLPGLQRRPTLDVVTILLETDSRVVVVMMPSACDVQVGDEQVPRRLLDPHHIDGSESVGMCS